MPTFYIKNSHQISRNKKCQFYSSGRIEIPGLTTLYLKIENFKPQVSMIKHNKNSRKTDVKLNLEIIVELWPGLGRGFHFSKSAGLRVCAGFQKPALRVFQNPHRGFLLKSEKARVCGFFYNLEKRGFSTIITKTAFIKYLSHFHVKIRVIHCHSSSKITIKP